MGSQHSCSDPFAGGGDAVARIRLVARGGPGLRYIVVFRPTGVAAAVDPRDPEMAGLGRERQVELTSVLGGTYDGAGGKRAGVFTPPVIAMLVVPAAVMV